MSEIILDENGNSIWADPQERLAEIEKFLKPKLVNIRNEIKENNMRLYPQKLNFLPAITNLLDANLRKRPLVRYDYAIIESMFPNILRTSKHFVLLPAFRSVRLISCKTHQMAKLWQSPRTCPTVLKIRI
jgi:hypothetical protein